MKGRKKLGAYITDKQNHKNTINEIKKVKDKSTRKRMLTGARKGESDYITDSRNKVSKKQFTKIMDNFNKENRYLRNNLKNIIKGKRIVNKYRINAHNQANQLFNQQMMDQQQMINQQMMNQQMMNQQIINQQMMDQQQMMNQQMMNQQIEFHNFMNFGHF